MERRHKEILKAKHSLAVAGKTVIVLDIEDNYRYNDPQLIELLKERLGGYLDLF